MPLELVVTAPGGELAALRNAIDAAKAGDRLAPVTVVVPTNVSGVMARRAMGRAEGVIGVDMVTLNRLAELLAGPSLAAAHRQPVSAPVVELTVRTVLAEAPGMFRSVAEHPATVTALREVHDELRLAGDEATTRLANGSGRGAEVARVSRAITRILASRWYDEADLFRVATDGLGDTLPRALRRVVLHLPARLTELSAAFVRRLAAGADITVVVSLTGDAAADRAHHETLEALGIAVPPTGPPSATAPLPPPARLVSTTDADDELAVAVRAVVDAARGELTGSPVPFERIAVLWPAHQPYARLAEHHLGAASIPWNGRGGVELAERLAPRLLLDLLDVDRRGLRRHSLFELLADVPSRAPDGTPRPTATWERVSRVAGVSDDDDWVPRLRALAGDERWGTAASSLAAFVAELRETLGRRDLRRSWRDWVDWSTTQLDAWMGPGAIARLGDADYRGWEALMSALERLRGLDAVGGPVTRGEFRAVLVAELDAAGVRDGRIGTGVTVGSLASAAGLDIDVAVVVGAAEGILPPAPRTDPLLADADRERAGLVRSDERATRLHHALSSLRVSVTTVITFPRGDLRATTATRPSRWLADTIGAVHVVASSSTGIAATAFAVSDRERRLGDLLRTVRSGGAVDADADEVLAPRLAMHHGRTANVLSRYDGDLSDVEVPVLGERPVSPTQIETWAACPHAYFARYLLGVRPIDEPDAEISINALDRGLVQHDTLDRFHHDVIDGRLPQPTRQGWLDEHRAALLAHFDDVCETASRLGRTGRPATWAGEQARMRADLLGWLEHDGRLAAARGATVVDSEHRFPAPADEAGDRPTSVVLPLPDGRELAVTGSIDRLDRLADGTLVVTDHKTGKDDKFRGLDAEDPTLAGTVFQLPTYAAAALARAGARPGSGDHPVRSEYSMFAKGRYQRIGYDLDPAVWDEVVDRLAHVVAGIEAGWFPQLPERPGFRFFPSCWYCEPDGLGTASAWERWVAKRGDERIAAWFGDHADETGDDDE